MIARTLVLKKACLFIFFTIAALNYSQISLGASQANECLLLKSEYRVLERNQLGFLPIIGADDLIRSHGRGAFEKYLEAASGCRIVSIKDRESLGGNQSFLLAEKILYTVRDSLGGQDDENIYVENSPNLNIGAQLKFLADGNKAYSVLMYSVEQYYIDDAKTRYLFGIEDSEYLSMTACKIEVVTGRVLQCWHFHDGGESVFERSGVFRKDYFVSSSRDMFSSEEYLVYDRKSQ